MSSQATAPEASPSTAGPVVLIAMVTLLVVGALDFGGWLDGWRTAIDGVLGGVLGETFARQLPGWVGWGAAMLLAVVLPVLVLQAVCLWRRLVLWLTTLVVMLSWAPVLALAAYRPDVVVACLAAAMAGLLAVVYAGRRGRVHNDAVSDEAS